MKKRKKKEERRKRKRTVFYIAPTKILNRGGQQVSKII